MTEPLKEEILNGYVHLINAFIKGKHDLRRFESARHLIKNGHVHKIDEMRTWLQPFGYSDTINEAEVNLRI